MQYLVWLASHIRIEIQYFDYDYSQVFQLILDHYFDKLDKEIKTNIYADEYYLRLFNEFIKFNFYKNNYIQQLYFIMNFDYNGPIYPYKDDKWMRENLRCADL